jgi:protein SCO1/2
MRGPVALPDHALTLSRRSFLGGTLALALSSRAAPVRAHNDAGVVEPPVAPPTLDLTLHDGTSTSLHKLLRGKVSAVQLMFTSCSATCPIQGALFAEGAKQLGERIADAQWLSLSIDPGRDTVQSLRSWLGRFGAHPRWHAALPRAPELDRFVSFLKAAKSGADRHTPQVYFFNRKGQLAMRSVDFPPAAELLRVLDDLARR